MNQTKSARRGGRPGGAKDHDYQQKTSDGPLSHKGQGPTGSMRPATEDEAKAARKRGTEEGSRIPKEATFTALDMGNVKLGVFVDCVPAYRDKKRKGPKPTIGQLRISEIEKLITARHGPAPVTGLDDLSIYARAVAHHLDDPEKLIGWVGHWVPNLDPAEVTAMVEDATRDPRRWKADAIAAMLGVTIAERTQLDIRTIGAIDRPKAMRDKDAKERRRAAGRERKAKKRAKAGSKSRAEYQAGSVAEQCRRAGISRNTYYDRLNAGLDPFAPAGDRSVGSSMSGSILMGRTTCNSDTQAGLIDDATFAAIVVELDDLAARQKARASPKVRIMTGPETREYLLARAAEAFARMADQHRPGSGSLAA